ncbi:PorA family protein [Nocardia thraciensis]
MALSAGTKRTVACLLVGLGALLIVAAVLVPTYAVGQLAKTPLDLEITTIAKSNPDAPSEVLDSKSLTSGDGPAKIDKNVRLLSQRFLTVEDPSDKTDVTIQAGQTLRNIDKQGDTGLLTATIDRVTIDRKNGMPVDTDPNGSIASTVNTKGESVAEPVQHTGLQYRFPIGTEKKTYPYFDTNARKSFDMNFVEETEINDLKVYHFQQQVPATNLAKAYNSPTNKLALPASKWGVEGGDATITMDRYYSDVRDVWVEPKTGTVIKGGEQIHMYYSRTGEPEVTALKSTLVFDDNTVNSQIAEAKKYTDELSLYGRTLPIVFAVLGVISLIVGLFLGVRGADGSGPAGRLVKRRSPSPNQPQPGADDSPTQQINIGKQP